MCAVSVMAIKMEAVIASGFREMLKDYPWHMEILEIDLLDVEKSGRYDAPYFEIALWNLEDALSSFISKARSEFEMAAAAGDRNAVEIAELSIIFGFLANQKYLRLF